MVDNYQLMTSLPHTQMWMWIKAILRCYIALHDTRRSPTADGIGLTYARVFVRVVIIGECVFFTTPPTNKHTGLFTSHKASPRPVFVSHDMCVGSFFLTQASLTSLLHRVSSNRQPSPSPRDRKMIIFIANRSYFPQPGRVYKAQEKAKHT